MALPELYLPPSYFEGVTKAAPPADTSEVGSTGLAHYGGVLVEEMLPSLQGARGTKVFVEMADNDPIMGGVLLAIDNLLRRVTWTWNPASDNSEARRWAEFMESVIHDMSASWADTMSSVFSFVPFGWSYHEIVLKRRNGQQPDTPGAAASSRYTDNLVGWRKLPIRAQETRDRWEMDPNGGVQGMWQNVNYTERRLIPIQRALLFRAGSRKDSPEPKGILRNAYRPWWFKRRFEELEGIGIERDLAGLPVGEVPAEFLASTATAEQKRTVDAVRTLITNVRRNAQEGVVWPRSVDEHGHEMYKLSLLHSDGKRQLDIDKAVGRKNMEMAVTALADWVLLGHEAVGSKALGSTKVDMFTTACETWTQAAAGVINAHAAPRLLALNGVGRDLVPELVPGRVSQVDIEMFCNALGTLVKNAVVTSDPALEDWVRETVGAPPREEATPGGAELEDEDVDPQAEDPEGAAA